MLFYFLPVLFCYGVILSGKTDRKKLLYMLLTYLCFFLCFGYMCGSDWRIYEEMYESINFDSLFYNYFSEPGYYIYMLIFKCMHIDFWWFFIITKMICFFIIMHVILEYSEGSRFVALMYFVPWYGFYLFIDNPMRNLIAISIVLLGLRYLIDRSFIKYLGCILFAAMFHFSAFIFVPMYFILNRQIKNWVYIVAFIAFNLFFSSRELLVSLIGHFSDIPYVNQKIEGYLLGDSEYGQGRVLSLGMIFHFLFFVLLLYKRNFIVNRKNGLIIFNSAVIYLLFYRLAITIEIFTRFQLYFSVFFCIGISFLIYAFTIRTRPVFITYLLIIAFIGGAGKIFSDYRYLPYTNYLVYFFLGEHPSYEYRSAYNIRNSPYTPDEMR